MLKTFWSEMSEIVKANCKELIYVRESAQSPSLGDPGNIHRFQPRLEGAGITQGDALDPQAASVRRRGGGRQANERENHQGQSH